MKPLMGLVMSFAMMGAAGAQHLAGAARAAAVPEAPAKVAFYGIPRGLGPQVERIQLGPPALPPVAHSIFCTQFPGECVVKRIAFRPGRVALTPERWQDLVRINVEVNRAIRFERNTQGVAAERWLIAPRAGECHDYAVTKRHRLLARNWPSRALLLAEVVTSLGEHHLVLVLRTAAGDVVIDNLTNQIRPWSQTNYRWMRIQSPMNPRYWATLANPSA
ncbi:MAG TPA: transglutaminase-like cysteine peptidase [Xanthobacteraceae bacterium]